MMRWIEFLLFSGLAVALHLVAFVSVPPTGAVASGTGGDAMVAIKAADATIAELVETWQRPPQPPLIDTPPLKTPVFQAAAPEMTQFEIAAAPKAAVQIVQALPPIPTQPPQVDTTPPPPPFPKPEPELKVELNPPKPPQKTEKIQAKARKAELTTAGQAQRRAAGSGGGVQAGTSGGAATATTDAGREAKLMNVWLSKIRSRIVRRQRYPSDTSGNGRVLMRLSIANTGQLLSYRIIKPSGNVNLDQAALKAVQRAGKFPRAPKGLTDAFVTFNMPLHFKH
ncbi:outer membrane transport energization protein TonB [Epibacterium ulvae]|uniref:Outer membrane transport energization protein TonB n=1 Tax=Epibacterium ulvae TaxID=1156985 RepID=A0A1G5QT29_9RHOB|nr:TonB family protein [Epibacterium ulvae]SCZ64700.1 outer membrane transport energization protein TonB [Epibacterium ulvae]